MKVASIRFVGVLDDPGKGNITSRVDLLVHADSADGDRLSNVDISLHIKALIDHLSKHNV